MLKPYRLVLFLVGVVLSMVFTARAARVSDHSRLAPLLATFEQYAEEVRNSWNVPGMAVAIVSADQVIYAKGFGVKAVGTTAPVDPHTVFQIGSASKAFTSTLAAMQVDAGMFQWTDRVAEHLPDFMMSDPWVTR
jgi:CubicO group peptidase (beta-lactamase class C family)